MIPIVGGRPDHELEPEGWTLRGGVSDLLDRIRSDDRDVFELTGAGSLDTGEHAAALVDLLLGVEGEPEDVSALNDLLARLGSSIRIRPSKGR
jgi:hypothetical protein